MPKLKADPGYFARENIDVYQKSDNRRVNPWEIDTAALSPARFLFRQRPGPRNVLGLIRLNMPNDAFIYLHDTPERWLFSRPVRAFSSGCIRVRRIAALTDWVLANEPSWFPGRAESVYHNDQTVRVTLERAIPVYVVYLTAWAQPGGVAQFRQDIYGFDRVGERAESYVRVFQPVQPVTP